MATVANSRYTQILTNLAATGHSFWAKREPNNTTPKHPEKKDIFCLPCALQVCYALRTVFLTPDFTHL